MSKGYTIQYFMDVLVETSNKELTNKGLFNVISPRYGKSSVKAEALASFVGGFYELQKILAGYSVKHQKLGKTPKTRLLNALKLRKKYGFISL